MAGTNNEHHVARSLLFVLAPLLVAGAVISYLLGVRATTDAQALVVQQAQAIVERSLPLVLLPSDLAAPATTTKAEQITQKITPVVLDPSPFDEMTLWSTDATILYSTDASLIGQSPEEDRANIREAARDRVVFEDSAGRFTVLVALHLRDDSSVQGVVQLTRPDDALVAAGRPWRYNAAFLGIALAVVCAMLWRALRMPVPPEATQFFPPQAAPVRMSPPSVHRVEVPTPGLREEADARRKAEDRARSAEERFAVLQDQYRATLEELKATQRALREVPLAPAAGIDPELEERMLKSEGRVRLLEGQLAAMSTERDKLAKLLAEASRVKPTESVPDVRSRQMEQEAIGLRAELEGAQTELSITRRELDAIKAQAARSQEIQEDLDASQVEVLHTRESLESTMSELERQRAELDDARTELRALRGEEQRAAVLDEELRAARAGLESLRASHRADLVEREADLEEKVRHNREDFQRELQAIQAELRAQADAKEAELRATMDARETELQSQLQRLETELGSRIASAESESQDAVRELGSAQVELQTLRDELDQSRQELAAGQDQLAKANGELMRSQTEIETLQRELGDAQRELHSAAAEVQTELGRGVELVERVDRAERELRTAQDRATRAEEELARVGGEAEAVAARLAELEERQEKELAQAGEQADLEDVLRLSQERLASQTEKLIEVEERAHTAERQLADALVRLEDVEAEARQLQMEKALHELQSEHEPAPTPERPEGSVEIGQDAPYEDRRASTPFTRELSLDAKKTLSSILGLTQVMKYKKDSKDQAQLIKQLTAAARRLDHTVTDLADADQLARGTIELTLRRSDLASLVSRVVEESGAGMDHDVRVEAEPIKAAVDQLRTEQILAGLLRASSDRTPHGKTITVRLQHADGGALLSVEDPETSSDASLSPVVKRFAEVQGGWARVESREGGGSAFRVFLPDGAGQDGGAGQSDAAAAGADVEAGDDLSIVVGDPNPDEGSWPSSSEQLLVQELHRLSAED